MISIPKLDKRDLVTIYFVSDGRSKYRSFYCQNCGQKIGSLEGGQVYSQADLDDVSRLPEQGKLTIACYGKFCHTYYRFTLI